MPPSEIISRFLDRNRARHQLTPMTYPTFPLYSYERFFAMDPNTSAKLAHVATLRGDIPRLLRHLPMAVLQTFNRHPKMRAMVLPGSSPQKVMISAPLADVAELKPLLSVYECTPDEEERAEQERINAALEDSSVAPSNAPPLRWMEFVQSECEKPIDREQEFPFYLVIRVDKSTQTFARLILFADHYMSDPTSGVVILRDILETAVKFSNSSTESSCELPVRESLYEATHYVNPIMNVLHEAVSKYVIQPLVNFDTSAFVPLLPIQAATQRDFVGSPPEPRNQSFALFAQGSEANMRSAMARCKEEGVSLQGAIVAATTMAFGLTKYDGTLSVCTEPLQLRMDVVGDRRKQVALKALGEADVLGASTNGEEPVGLYSTSGNLVFTSSEGVDPHGLSFWDVARKADLEWECVLLGHELKMQHVFANETLNAENRTGSGVNVTNCMLSDVAVSCLDYSDTTSSPFPSEIILGGKSVTVEDLHVYNSHPSLSSTCKLFVAALSHFSYGLMHKLEPEVAQTLFGWMIRCTERIGEYGQQETFAQAADRLVNSTVVVVGDIVGDEVSIATEPVEIAVVSATPGVASATVTINS